MPWNALKTDGAGRRPAGSDGLYVVGRQHPRVAGALHGPVHPAVVDLLHVDNGVPVLEGDLVLVGGTVVIHGAVPLPAPSWGAALYGNWGCRLLVATIGLGRLLLLGLLVNWGAGRDVMRLLLLLGPPVAGVLGISALGLQALTPTGAHAALLKLLVVFYVADLILGLLDSLEFRRVRHHAEAFALVLLKLLLVAHLTLELTLLLEAEVFWGVSHHGEGLLGVVCVAVGLLLVALVVLHVESHLAGLAVEACFMPELIQTVHLLRGVHDLAAPGAVGIHDSGKGWGGDARARARSLSPERAGGRRRRRSLGSVSAR